MLSGKFRQLKKFKSIKNFGTEKKLKFRFLGFEIQSLNTSVKFYFGFSSRFAKITNCWIFFDHNFSADIKVLIFMIIFGSYPVKKQFSVQTLPIPPEVITMSNPRENSAICLEIISESSGKIDTSTSFIPTGKSFFAR